MEDSRGSVSPAPRELMLDLLELQCKSYLCGQEKCTSFNAPVFDSLLTTNNQAFWQAFPNGYGLLGRSKEDPSKIYFWSHGEGFTKRSFQSRKTQAQSSVLRAQSSILYASYHAQNISQTSGTVSCCAVTRNGGVFVGSIAENHTDYNRIGELIYCKEGAVKYLKGHFAQSAQSSEQLRQTVSDMKYCPVEDIVITVGYDGALKVWDERRLPNCIHSCSTYKAEKEQIQPLADKHRSKNLFAFTTTENSVYLFSYGHNGEDGAFGGKLNRIMHRRRRGGAGEEKHACITGQLDCVQFMGDPTNVSFLALTGNSDSRIPDFIYSLPSARAKDGPGGVLEAFQLPNGRDASNPARTFSFAIPGVGFSCSAVQENSNGMRYAGSSRSLVALGTGVTGDESLHGDGNLYLLDGNGRSPLVAKIRTGHRECELISFSPCGLFLVSCNTADNQALVYDIRSPALPLHSFSHRGDPSLPVESVMSARWSSVHPGTLWTGGADRFVRVWDVLRGAEDASVGRFEHRHPVNAMGFDEESELKFAVGTLNDASVYSLHCPEDGLQQTVEFFE